MLRMFVDRQHLAKPKEMRWDANDEAEIKWNQSYRQENVVSPQNSQVNSQQWREINRHTHTHIATAAAAAAFCSLTTKIKSKTHKLECTIALLRSFQHWYTQMQSTAEQTELLSFVGGLMLTNCSNMTHEHEKDRESWGFGFCWRRLDWGEIQVCSYRPIKQICHSNWNSQQKANKSLSQWITLESFSRTSKPHTTIFWTRLHRFYWCRCISLENAQCASLKNV